MSFNGIPATAIDFYERLEADNSKAFWEANKAVFVASVKQPVLDLAAELDEYGPFHVFRPHNDLRFSKNRPPYKTHQGAYGESEGGAGHYFQVSATGLMVASGYYAMASDQLARFRAAVDDDKTGSELVALLAALPAGYEFGAIGELKTAPRGFAKDHPRIEILRRKGLMMSKPFGAPKWLHTKQAAAKIREVWADAAPVNTWLDHHVGPTTLTFDGMFPT